jgi:hypothetical protein
MLNYIIHRSISGVWYTIKAALTVQFDLDEKCEYNTATKRSFLLLLLLLLLLSTSSPSSLEDTSTGFAMRFLKRSTKRVLCTNLSVRSKCLRITSNRRSKVMPTTSFERSIVFPFMRAKYDQRIIVRWIFMYIYTYIYIYIYIYIYTHETFKVTREKVYLLRRQCNFPCDTFGRGNNDNSAPIVDWLDRIPRRNNPDIVAGSTSRVI